jgi:hypothetical protein
MCEVADNGQVALDIIHRAEQNALQGDRTGSVRSDPIGCGDAVRLLREMAASGALPRQLLIGLMGNTRQGQIGEAPDFDMDDGRCDRCHRCLPKTYVC